MKTRRIVMIGLLVAMYVVLSLFLTVTLWNFKITFEALPILIGGFLLGPVDGLIIGFLGSFLNQMLTYGFTPTTLLWVLPHAFSGLLVGFFARKMGSPLSTLKTAVITVISALSVTVLNTLAMYVDSKMFDYYSKAFVFGALGVRIVTGVATAVAFAVLLPPLLKQLKKIEK
ncbi:MAG: folate family ECF transporter S component [Oscillospiraceae bacterium]|nr:folate family ECF transporter S component [Oscillospiraceae bacterium]